MGVIRKITSLPNKPHTHGGGEVDILNIKSHLRERKRGLQMTTKVSTSAHILDFETWFIILPDRIHVDS